MSEISDTATLIKVKQPGNVHSWQKGSVKSDPLSLSDNKKSCRQQMSLGKEKWKKFEKVLKKQPKGKIPGSSIIPNGKKQRKTETR